MAAKSAPPRPPAAPESARLTPDQVRRYRAYLRAEWEAAALYRRLADTDPDADRAEVLRTLATMEDKHAARWRGKLDAGGHALPGWRPSLRSHGLSWMARLFGTSRVIPILERAEATDGDMYADEPAAQDFALDEQQHVRTFARLQAGHGAPSHASATQIASREGRHRDAGGGSFRAGVFGINDGLLSNLSLVMGVAGAQSGQGTILLAGIAGLLAGAFSMATGEYVSMRVQRELFEREISIEREELEENPEEERQELILIYRAKGLPPDEAERVATRMLADRTTALDTLAREELGLDPSELGSPVGAAATSFAMFALGAVIPVVPFLLLTGQLAFGVSILLSTVAILVVGGVTSVLTGRSIVAGALRQFALGAAAAAVTYGAGHVVGGVIAG